MISNRQGRLATIKGSTISKYDKWESIYKNNRPEDLPWEIGRPRPGLVELFDSGRISVRGRALDLCCGLGTNTIFLSQQGFDVAGFDISMTAIHAAKIKALESNVNIDFINGNSAQLPFKDNIFNFVLDFGCFHHILPEDRDVFVRNVVRVMQPTAFYFLTCFSDRNGPAWNHFSDRDLIDIFGPVLSIISIEPMESQEHDSVYRYFYTALMTKN